MQELTVIKVFKDGFQFYHWNNHTMNKGWHRGRDIATLGKNFSDAVKEAKTKYIVRIDGDDSQSAYFNQYGLHLIKAHGFAVSPRYLIKDRWNFVDKPQGAGIFYEREKFLEVGGYDESLDYQADLDFYIRYTIKFKIMVEYGLIYLWDATKGRSRTLTPEISKARSEILNRYKLDEKEVHHFGGYAYL